MTSSSGPDGRVRDGGGRALICLLAGLSVVSVTFSVAVSSIAMGAAFIAMAVVIARGGVSVVPRTGLEAAFLLYAAAELLSSAFSVDPADSFLNSKRVLLIGIAYATAYSFREERRMTVVLGALAGLGAVTALAELSSLRMIDGQIERPGLFQMPMTEGGVRMIIILAVIPFTVAPALALRWRIALGGAVLALLAGLVITQTRSAWIGFVAGMLVVGTIRDRRMLAVLAVVIALFALLAPVEFRNRALSVAEVRDAGGFVADSLTTTAESNVSRIQMLTTGWRMFLDRPVFGWGDIGLRNYYMEYVTPMTPGEGGHLHNNLMEALVTLGAPGFCAVVYLFVMMGIVIRRAGAGAERGSIRGALATGMLAAYAGFHVLGLFEYNFGDHEVMVLVWFLTGLAAAASAMKGEGA